MPALPIIQQYPPLPALPPPASKPRAAHTTPPLDLHPRTPIKIQRLAQLLITHPDQRFVAYVTEGLEHGFDIGYEGARTNLFSPNLPSSSAHVEFISSHLQGCCIRGETAGPYPSPPFPIMSVSGIGVVPKKHNKLRMIHNLSSPHGTSVNDHIRREEFSLQYVTVDDAIFAILHSGPGTYLLKVDIKSAFRICPVRREDWPLLGIQWNGEYYFEMVLPFGLRSSPAIFNSVADALEWVLKHQFAIPVLIHYLDDFLCISGRSQHLAQQQLSIILDALRYLGVPLATDKVEGPAQVLTFLGIILDCIRMEARLPLDKVEDIRTLLQELLDSEFTTVGDLDSFLGKLSFASRVVIPGRTFMRRLWDTLGRFRNGRSFFRIRLDPECRRDLEWWKILLEHWNGKSFFLNNTWTNDTDLGLFTDASGSGWGAYYGAKGRWRHGAWNPDQQRDSIEYKELYAVVEACRTWGHEWARQRIRLHCDNQSVVDCIRSGTSRAPRVMELLRSLFLVCALNNFQVAVVHVAGARNSIADALSRSRLQVFRHLAPAARHTPDPAPPLLWDHL